LDKPGIREALLKYYNKYYSSDIMTLCISHNDSLDNMQKKVEEMFSMVENKGTFPVSLKSYNHPLIEGARPNLIKLVPIKNDRNIKVKFVLPEISKYTNLKLSDYISHLIGHESDNSI